MTAKSKPTKPSDIPPKAVQATPDTITITFRCGTRVTVSRSFLEALRLTIIADAHHGRVDLTKVGWDSAYMVDAWRRTVAEKKSPVLH